MTSVSNSLQIHGIWYQEDIYFQLVFFLFHKFSLLFSDLYTTFSLLDCNQMKILFLILWENVLVSPQNHHHQENYFWLFIDILDIKQIPMTKEMHKYLFCKNKGKYCYGSSPKSTFMKKNQMDQKSFYRVNVLGHEFYFPSQMFLLRYKTRCPLHLY